MRRDLAAAVRPTFRQRAPPDDNDTPAGWPSVVHLESPWNPSDDRRLALGRVEWEHILSATVTDCFLYGVVWMVRLRKLTVRNLYSADCFSVHRLVCLEQLEICAMRRAGQIAGLGRLTRLRTLVIKNSWMESLPDGVTVIVGLTELDLTGNRIRTLPANFGRLQSLQTLSLRDNRLGDLPPAMRELASLRELDLHGNFFDDGEGVHAPAGLRVLNLSRNELFDLPTCVRGMTGLTTLACEVCSLHELPDWIGELTTLTGLSARDNSLRSLPNSLFTLPHLRTLDLGGNQISQLGEQVGGLQELVRLDMFNLPLTELPAALLRLPKLARVNCGGCRLTMNDASLSLHTELRARGVHVS